jgi:hypothetical protein
MGFTLVHGEKDYKQCLAHYEEYTDVVGDHFLNLVATTQPLNAYLATGDEKYRKWILEYMDAWLERMRLNNSIIPSKIGLDGKIGGDDGKWWGNVYGWGFSPVNPTNGRRENRNRIPRALVGFNNALWVSGDQKYVDAWRNMMQAVNSHARKVGAKSQYPTMHGEQGWYGWSDKPWSVGALEMWYWSMKADDHERVKDQAWVKYLDGKNPGYPETVLERDLESIRRKVAAFRKDKSTPDKRLSDNMLDLNPAAAAGLIQLMLGGLPPNVDGGLLNVRLRYFDPERRRAGLPEDLGALVSEMTDNQTVVTLVNLSKSQARTLIVQGGAYGEHLLETVTVDGQTRKVGARVLQVDLQPGCGQKLVLHLRRYANQPTVAHPWPPADAGVGLENHQVDQDKEAEKLFRDMEKKLRDAKSVKVVGKAEFTGKFDQFAGTHQISLLWAQGKKARVEWSFKQDGKDHKVEMVADGQTMQAWESTSGEKANKPIDDKHHQFILGTLVRSGLFAGAQVGVKWDVPEQRMDADKFFPVSDFKMAGKEKVDGRDAVVIT